MRILIITTLLATATLLLNIQTALSANKVLECFNVIVKLQFKKGDPLEKAQAHFVSQNSHISTGWRNIYKNKVPVTFLLCSDKPFQPTTIYVRSVGAKVFAKASITTTISADTTILFELNR